MIFYSNSSRKSPNKLGHLLERISICEVYTHANQRASHKFLYARVDAIDVCYRMIKKNKMGIFRQIWWAEERDTGDVK